MAEDELQAASGGEHRIRMDEDLSDSVKQKLKSLDDALTKNRDKGRRRSNDKKNIPRVPKELQGNKENTNKYFQPTAVSIGPYHHHNQNLKVTEGMKIELAAIFIENHGLNKEDACRTIQMKIANWKGLYEVDAIREYADEELTWMFLIDGCVVLHFLYVVEFMENLDELEIVQAVTDKSTFGRDIMLLENQLPYQLLQTLIGSTREDARETLETAIQMFIYRTSWNDLAAKDQTLEQENTSHLLELLRSSLVTEVDKPNGKSCHKDKGDKTRPSAYNVLPKQFNFIQSRRLAKMGMAGPAEEIVQHSCHFLSSEGEGDISTPEGRGDKSGPKGEGDISRPKVRGDKSKPKGQGDKSGPRVSGGTSRPEGDKSFKIIGSIFDFLSRNILHLFLPHRPTSPFLGLPNIEDLKGAGVEFKLNNKGRLIDVEYEYGTLHLPVIVVDDTFLFNFFNLMACEIHMARSSEDFKVCGYIFFLALLIRSPEDVRELRVQKILSNRLYSDEHVVQVFKEINCYYDRNKGLSSYLGIFEKIEEHYKKKKYHIWVVQLKRRYFDSPWSVIALSGAILGLLLTLIQTVYAILGQQKV